MWKLKNAVVACLRLPGGADTGYQVSGPEYDAEVPTTQVIFGAVYETNFVVNT
jgi:hypothetical protein